MQNNSNVISDQIEGALRRIVRSMDLHSRSLVQRHGLTGPQAALMKALSLGPLTAGDLANRINLSQGTVTDILKRLEVRGLITRLKDVSDKRRVIVSLSEQGQEIINKSSDQLQAPFAVRLSELPEWEQSQLLAALQRIAFMMEGSNQARVVLNLPDQEDKVVMNSSPVGEFPSDDL